MGAWIDGDDLSRYFNDVHYDAAGQLELGRRFADAYLSTVPEPSSFLFCAASLDWLGARRRKRNPVAWVESDPVRRGDQWRPTVDALDDRR